MSIRKYVPGVIFLTTVSAAVIAFTSPLFRVLGFEYSSLSALVLSCWVMLAASKRAMTPEKKYVRSLVLESAVYFLTPLAVSLLSTAIVPNCDLWYGLLYYVEIVPPTVIIAIMLGILIGRCSSSNRLRIAVVIGSWLVWLVISLLPGYFGPQIFSYGWQYGYFPGFVWDEAMELRNAYWWSRLFVMLPILICVFAVKPKRVTSRMVISALAPPLSALLLVIGFTFALPGTGIITTKAIVEHAMPDTLFVQPATVHYYRSSMNEDERTYLRYQLQTDLDSIKTFYHLPAISQPIDIYLYPSAEAMNKYVGTRSASISKPWRSELHIAKENLHSLKHELTHVILAEFGKFPFDVSYSTGLTEGAAEAADPYYDGIRTPSELAAEIMQMGLSTGVQGVMSFTGFASNASGKSYVLAGSFASYLINRFGPETYLRVYRSLDYNDGYRSSLESLEHDWQTSIEQRHTIVTHYDSLRIRYLFDRKSIVSEPCLRRTGRMMKYASELYAQKKYSEADNIYKHVVTETGRTDAARNRAFCYIAMNDFAKALSVLDSSLTVMPVIDRTSLHLLRGDILYIVKADKREAMLEWGEAEHIALNSEQLLAAFARRFCFDSTHSQLLTKEFLTGLYTNKPIEVLGDYLDHIIPSANDSARFDIARLHLRARLYESKGKLRQAANLYREAKTKVPPEIHDESFRMFLRLIDDRFSGYYKAFSRK